MKFTYLSKYRYAYSASLNQLDRFKKTMYHFKIASSRLVVPIDKLELITNQDQLETKFDNSQYENLNPPEKSFLQMKIPLKNDLDVRNNFQLFDSGHCRKGKILEVLDQAAGVTSFYHCQTNIDEQTIVTASMNDFLLFESIVDDKDLLINMYPTWTGRSSIQIRCDLYQSQNSSNEDDLQHQQQQDLVASVRFTMVSKNIQDYAKSVQVPKLSDGIFEPEKSSLRFELGEELYQNRKKKQINEKTQPNVRQFYELHELFTNQNQLNKNKQFQTMESTKQSKVQIMHKQDRNGHQKIFGGLIMREALELAWLTAKIYEDQQPQVVNISDVIFNAPVEIGSILKFEAKITYCQDRVMMVNITSFMIVQNEKIHCTDMNIIFNFENVVKQVYPENYLEGIEQIQAKNMLNNFINYNY